MPYEWIPPAQSDQSPQPLAEMHAWPYRSLPRKGFVWFIGLSVGIAAIPLSALIGSAVLWAVLPFLALVIAAIWIALERSYRDGATIETLRLWEDKITLHHHDPRRGSFEWAANPHWVRTELHRNHRIKNYLTLTGGGREVELGSFLRPEERQQIYFDLNEKLDLLKGA